MFIQSWYNIYQAVVLTAVLLVAMRHSRNGNKEGKPMRLPAKIMLGMVLLFLGS